MTFLRSASRTWTLAAIALLAALAAIAGALAESGGDLTSPPATPNSVSIARADGKLTASWDAVPGATSYHVTYSDNGKQSWQLAALDHAETNIRIDVDNAKTYVVGVRAKNEHGGSGWRNSAAAGPYTPPPPPSAVAAVSLTRADGTLTASWDAPAGATSYHVTYTDDNAQSWQLAAFDLTATSITISADNAKTYIVGVRAKNAGGGANWRNSPASGPYTPPAPRGIIVQDGNGNPITALSVPEGGETSYQVKLTVQPDEDVEVCIGLSVRDNNDPDISFKGEPSDAAALKLTFTPANWNTAQTVTLIAAEDDDYANGARDVTHDARDWYGGKVDWTATEIDNDEPTAPARPTGLSARPGDQRVILTWDDPADSSISRYEYRIRYTGVAWSDWTAMPTSGATTTSFRVEGLDNGIEYRFKIRAVNSVGNSRPAPAAAPWYVAATPEAAPTLTVENETADGADLTLGNYDGTWYYRADEPPGAAGAAGASGASGQSGCVGPVNGQQTTVGGLDADTTYTITVYGGGCSGAAIASGQLVTAAGSGTLTASNVAYYGATLTITGHSSNWYYKQTAPSSGDCTLVYWPGNTASLTRLEPGTSYTFKAYSNAACNTEVTSDATDAEFTTSSVALSTPWHIIPEGSSETHTVWLSHQPTANVTVTITTTGDSDITANPTTLTFTPSNWSVPQTVTLTAAQDTDTVPGAGKGDGDYAYGATTVTHTATSTDANFNNVSTVLDATEGDDDVCAGTTAVGGSTVTSGPIVEDCDTLLAAKDIIKVSDSVLDNWKTDTAMSSWTGVKVENSRVTELNVTFYWYSSTGNVPNTVADLDALTKLVVESGVLASRPGPMPRGLANLTGLTTLRLYNRELTGQLPANIGNLTELTELALDNSQLSGPLPASLAKLTNLTRLWLNNNRFSGQIPNQLGGLTSLTSANFALGENRLSGCIPAGWSKYLSDINPQHDASGNDVTLPLCVGAPTKPTGAPKNNDIEVSWTTPSGAPNWYQIQWRPCQVTPPQAVDGKWQCIWRTAIGEPWQPAWTSWEAPIIGMDGKRGGQAVVTSSPTLIGETTNRASWSGDIRGGVPYQVRVRAHDNFIGYGAWSEPSDMLWSTDMPDPPAPTLSASDVAGTTATLTIANHAGAWYYQADTAPDTSCQGPVHTTSQALSGLTVVTTYTYKAYSDSTCTSANELAAAPAFTTTASLTASGITTITATLTIAGHTAQWWYDANTGPDNTCQGPVAANDATEDLTGLTAGTTYTYKAYSATGCNSANEVASETFTAAVTVSNLSQTTTLTHIVAGTAQWAQEFTTGSNSGGYTLSSVTLNFAEMHSAGSITVYLRSRLSNGKPDTTTALATLSGTPAVGDSTFTCSGAGCALEAGKQYFVHLGGTGNTTQAKVNTTLDNGQTLQPSANGWSIADAMRASSLNWGENTQGRSLKIRVTAVPK